MQVSAQMGNLPEVCVLLIYRRRCRVCVRVRVRVCAFAFKEVFVLSFPRERRRAENPTSEGVVCNCVRVRFQENVCAFISQGEAACREPHI
jgi:hypothetical protein